MQSLELSFVDFCGDILRKIIYYLSIHDICRLRIASERLRRFIATIDIVHRPIIIKTTDIDRIFLIQSNLKKKSIMNLSYDKMVINASIISKMTKEHILKCETFRSIEISEAYGWKLSFSDNPIYETIVSKIDSVAINNGVNIEHLIKMPITKISFFLCEKITNPHGRKLEKVTNLIIKSYLNPEYYSIFLM